MARILDFKPRSRSRGFFLSSNLKGAGSGLTLPLSFLQRCLTPVVFPVSRSRIVTSECTFLVFSNVAAPMANSLRSR